MTKGVSRISVRAGFDGFCNVLITLFVGPEWRQFRFSVGAPDAEAKFRVAVQTAQEENAKARQYPSLYVGGFPARLDVTGTHHTH